MVPNMGKTMILTEKHSVAQDFARVLSVVNEAEGKIENENYVITWCQGHLVEMCYPEAYDEKYKQWNIKDLPFIPDDFKYRVKNKERYKVVHEQLYRNDIDTVLFAGDAGREGEYIYRLILHLGGMRKGMTALRVWIDSYTDEAIKRGIKEAKPIREYDNLSAAGFARSIEDYLVGMNFSRLMTCKYGKKFNSVIKSEKWKSIDVGRVMSCVLGMVVGREREIRNFKAVSFYRIAAETGGIEAEWKVTEDSRYFNSPLLYKENGFIHREEADSFCSVLAGKNAVIKKIETYMSNKKAPLLFNLAELQNECARKFKISPSETLEIAQFLYGAKMTTYPRTDARVLSSAVAKEICVNVEGLKKYQVVSEYVEKILEGNAVKNISKSVYTDDSKITDHYALIPTGNIDQLEKLSELQKNVFELIVRRFLSIFFPPASYKNAKVEFAIENEHFFCSDKVLLNPGYMKVSGYEEKENASNGLVSYVENKKEGQEVSISCLSVKEGKTSPPKRYNTGSMILAMENAGNLIEDSELREQIKGSGIGTSATRAEILKKLEAKGYLNVSKKTQIITPHEDGEAVYDILKEVLPDFLSPQMTAEWEKKLDKISDGTMDYELHQREVEDYVKSRVEEIKNLNNGENYEGEKFVSRKICKCPVCKAGIIVTRPYGYSCSNYKKEGGCSFAVGKVAGVSLSEAQIRQLATAGKTEVIHKFKSKNGKIFPAVLVLDKEEDKVNIKMQQLQKGR